jgi:hypothetical protein
MSMRDGEMENISGPSGILLLSSRVDAGQHCCKTTEYRSTDAPSSKCNVLRESLSEDSQNIHCATFKRRVSWVISIYL